MSSPASLPGIWPALLTPLNADLSIDHGRLVSHSKQLLAAGCGGVTPFGTTGEGPSFSVVERRAAVDALIAGGIPASEILVSTSCAALPETVELTKHAVDVGAWGSLILPPFYLKGVSDAGIVDCYRWIVDRIADPRLRIMLYHIPQVTGVPLSAAVIEELVTRYPGTFVGIKDSAGDRAHSLMLADRFMDRLTVHVGHEPDLPTLGRRGSTGAVSGLANFIPQAVHRLVAAPDDAGTAKDVALVDTLLARLGGYSLTPALKGIMAALDDDPAWLRVRPPLVALTAERHAQLVREMREIGVVPA